MKSKKGTSEIAFFMALIVIVPIIVFAFAITGITKITVERPYITEYKTCSQEKQVLSDQLGYCQDIKGIATNNNASNGFFYFIGILVYIGGFALLIWNVVKKNKLDELELDIGKRGIELSKKEEDLKKVTSNQIREQIINENKVSGLKNGKKKK
jgi:hypothetical protein